MTPCPLLSEKALTQQITTPLDLDVKWTVFTFVTSDRHNMPSYGSKPSQRPAKDRDYDQGSKKPEEQMTKVIFKRNTKKNWNLNRATTNNYFH